MRRFALGLLPAAILLSGCAADEPPPPCPPVQAPASLDRFTWFEGGGRDLTQVLYSGRIDGVDMACEYDEEGVDLDLRVRLVVERGPADRSRQADFQYFVAIEDGVGNITAKEVFDIRAPFEGNIRRVARFDELELRIPSPPQGFRQTRVLIGFQLTPEQLEHNRSHKQ
ncbi:MAG TPA: hypothetical protein VIR38_06840 [Thalassobaculum sp.]